MTDKNGANIVNYNDDDNHVENHGCMISLYYISSSLSCFGYFGYHIIHLYNSTCVSQIRSQHEIQGYFHCSFHRI